MKSYNNIMLIGCGGVGSILSLFLGNVCQNLHIVDPDIYEPHNIDRQPLAKGKLGMPKVECLAIASAPMTSAKVHTHCKWFDEKTREELMKACAPDLIAVAVDNDKARECIHPLRETHTILWAANELWMPQAGISYPDEPWDMWKAFQPADDGTGANPVACGRQTIHANACAAAMAAQILMFDIVDTDDRAKLPIFVAKNSGTPLYTMNRSEV